jgi:hypothetical protein
MARSSRRFGKKMPGVSTNMICALFSMTMPRGLHLAGYNRDLGADQSVDQRGLADIGRTDQRDESASGPG